MKNKTNWNELAKVHHERMVEKGFEKDYNHAKLLMWGIEEIGELSTALRKGKRANETQFYMRLHGEDNVEFASLYEAHIKGRAEEEMADVMLIIMHFCAKNWIRLIEGEYNHLIEKNVLLILANISNFFALNVIVLHERQNTDNVFVRERVISIFNHCLVLAEILDIDLEEQVKLKMRYNLTRPHRHGDKN